VTFENEKGQLRRPVTASAAMARFHATNAKGILGPRRSVSCKGTPRRARVLSHRP
jgi:hypothetical protein